jgi:hypothetical protein
MALAQLDRVAFRAWDFAGMHKISGGLGLDFEARDVIGAGGRRTFLPDSNRVMIGADFRRQG